MQICKSTPVTSTAVMPLSAADCRSLWLYPAPAIMKSFSIQWLLTVQCACTAINVHSNVIMQLCKSTPVTSTTVMPLSAAVCRSMWSDPTPAVMMSFSFSAFWILSLLMYAGWKGVVIRISISLMCLSNSALHSCHRQLGLTSGAHYRHSALVIWHVTTLPGIRYTF